MKKVYLIFLILFTTGCTTNKDITIKEPVVEKKLTVKESIDYNIPQKIIHISQNPDDYTRLIKEGHLKSTQEQFEKQYFRAWSLKDIDKLRETLQWGFRTYKQGYSYGENLQLLKQDFFDEMRVNSNFINYATLKKKAITTKDVNLRVFPTDKPLLLNPKRAGEGFPFDYLQNSSLSANKPIFATHYSKDKQWVHIISSFSYGWIKADEIAFIKDTQAKLWREAKQIHIIKDKIPLYSMGGSFLFKSTIGTLFALINEDEKNFIALSCLSYENSQPHFVKVKISKNNASIKALDFNPKNLNNITTQLLQSNYGWGGMYGQRDCSSTMRDLFAPFGVWLPRNSYQQSKVGDVVSFTGLSDDEKIAIIKDRAIPFKTFLYKKGHIVLYVGIVENEIVVMQNLWGIKTKKNGIEGRFIVGKTIFSTLKIGNNLRDYDDSKSILGNLKSMNTLY